MAVFTDITEKHISSLDLAERKKLGQYMTPSPIGDAMAKMLEIDVDASPQVLDPACGTGELLLAARRACSKAELFGFDANDGMVNVARSNVEDADIRNLSIFDVRSRSEHGKYDYVIGNPPYFEMKKNDPLLAEGGIDGFASLDDKGRLNIYALFVEYALRLVKTGGKVVYLVPPSMNNGAFFKCLRRRILELGKILDIRMIRDNSSFDDALTSVQILLLERTENGYEENLEASSKFVYDTGSTVIFTDRKETIEKFAKGKRKIKDLGFKAKTGTVMWNRFKGCFSNGNVVEVPNDRAIKRADGKYEQAPEGKVALLFAKDISTSNTVELCGKVSSGGHWIDLDKVKPVKGTAIIVNRIVGSLDNPRLRFALVEDMEFCGENHVNVIIREDGDAEKIRKLYKALSAIDSTELSEYLKAVTGNTQLSATELNELPVKL